jgi:hypothetical protein
MANNNEHDRFDDAFRQRIERLELPPLPINLDRVRADTLALQLAKATQQLQWLRGITGLLVLLLGGLGIGYQQYNPVTPMVSQTTKSQATIGIPLARLDTVYIAKYVTRTEKIMVPVYTETYRQANESKADIETLKNTILIETNPSLVQKLSQVSSANRDVSAADERDSDDIVIAKNTQRIAPIQENSYTTDTEATQNSQPLTIEQLTPKGIKGYFILRTVPAVRYKPATLAASKLSEPTMTLTERLSVSVYAGVEQSSVDIRRDQIDAFSYSGNERISSTNVYGLRMGVKLTNRLRISAGYEEVNYTFESNNAEKIKLKAELIDGQPAFVYRSIFGSAIVPNQELSKTPALGELVTLENEENHAAGYARIPVTLRYDFWSKPIYWKGRKITALTLYGSAGGFYGKPSQQELNVELYESSRNEFYTKLTNFRNTASIWGWNLGGGAELRVSQKINAWIEPSYYNSATSMVRDLPLRTFPKSLGLRFGLQYQLGK